MPATKIGPDALEILDGSFEKDPFSANIIIVGSVYAKSYARNGSGFALARPALRVHWRALARVLSP